MPTVHFSSIIAQKYQEPTEFLKKLVSHQPTLLHNTALTIGTAAL